MKIKLARKQSLVVLSSIKQIVLEFSTKDQFYSPLLVETHMCNLVKSNLLEIWFYVLNKFFYASKNDERILKRGLEIPKDCSMQYLLPKQQMPELNAFGWLILGIWKSRLDGGLWKIQKSFAVCWRISSVLELVPRQQALPATLPTSSFL